MGFLKVGIGYIVQLLIAIGNKAKSVRSFAILALPLAGLLVLGSPGSAYAVDEVCIVNVTTTRVNVEISSGFFEWSDDSSAKKTTIKHEDNTAECVRVGGDSEYVGTIKLSLPGDHTYNGLSFEGEFEFTLVICGKGMNNDDVRVYYQANKALKCNNPGFGGHHLGPLYVNSPQLGTGRSWTNDDDVYRVIIHDRPLTDKEKKEIWDWMKNQTGNN